MAVLDELWDSTKVCEYLEIKPNNLHQLNYRKQLVYVKKENKKGYYKPEDVIALKEKRCEKLERKQNG